MWGGRASNPFSHVSSSQSGSICSNNACWHEFWQTADGRTEWFFGEHFRPAECEEEDEPLFQKHRCRFLDPRSWPEIQLFQQSQTSDCCLAPRSQNRSKRLTLYTPKYKHIVHEKQHRRRKPGGAEGVEMANMVWWTVWDLEHDTTLEQFQFFSDQKKQNLKNSFNCKRNRKQFSPERVFNHGLALPYISKTSLSDNTTMIWWCYRPVALHT